MPETAMNQDTLPKFGQILPNGATVVDYTHLSDGGSGFLPYGVVLANKGASWITWMAAQDEFTGEWNCSSGHYFRGESFSEAVGDYKERCGE